MGNRASGSTMLFKCVPRPFAWKFVGRKRRTMNETSHKRDHRPLITFTKHASNSVHEVCYEFFLEVGPITNG